MLGRLSWSAIPLDQPIVMGTCGTVGVVLLAIFILVMRMVDVYWMVIPDATKGAGLSPSWIDVAAVIGLGDFFFGGNAVAQTFDSAYKLRDAGLSRIEFHRRGICRQIHLGALDARRFCERALNAARAGRAGHA